MEGRALRILLLLIGGAIVMFWVVRPKNTRVAIVEAGILPPGADARVEGVTLLQSGDRGDLALSAKDAEWSRETETFHLNDVEIRFQVTDTAGNTSRGGLITGERGDAKTNGKEFTLEGKVRAETFDGYRLETSDVRYDHEKRKADTTRAVQLTGPGLSVTGKGATVDWEGQKVEIRGRVKAHLLPTVLDDQASRQGIDLREAP